MHYDQDPKLHSFGNVLPPFLPLRNLSCICNFYARAGAVSLHITVKRPTPV